MLLSGLVQEMERNRPTGLCEVRYLKEVKIDARSCQLIEIEYGDMRAPHEFHRAKIYIDKDLQIPVRFVFYDRPLFGSEPRVAEEYTFTDIELNVGLSDQDFDITNPAYDFADH